MGKPLSLRVVTAFRPKFFRAGRSGAARSGTKEPRTRQKRRPPGSWPGLQAGGDPTDHRIHEEGHAPQTGKGPACRARGFAPLLPRGGFQPEWGGHAWPVAGQASPPAMACSCAGTRACPPDQSAAVDAMITTEGEGQRRTGSGRTLGNAATPDRCWSNDRYVATGAGADCRCHQPVRQHHRQCRFGSARHHTHDAGRAAQPG